MSYFHALVLLAFVALAPTAQAGAGCVLTVTRTACKGKAKESFSKCGGKATCTKNEKAANAADCANVAKKSCEGNRAEVTYYKKTTATFDGKGVENGKDFCDGIPGFKVCKP